jgi:NAD(P)H dehydrogenase (quinone)
MRILIVYAHEEPKSFNGALKELAVSVLTDAGHEVKVSDLYAMHFNPVGGKNDFASLKDAEFFKYQIEQSHAMVQGTLGDDIRAEQEKVLWADILILQFPLWWFSLPAILKGWVDRVFAMGFAYGGGRVYDTGVFKGKRAMLVLTTGGAASSYTADGRNDDISKNLFHIEHGILSFTGFAVLPRFVAWGVARASVDERQKYLKDYRDRLSSLESIDYDKHVTHFHFLP